MPVLRVSYTVLSQEDRVLIRDVAPIGSTYYIKNMGTWVHYLRYRSTKGLGAWVVYEYGKKWSVTYSHLSSLGKLHALYPDSELWGY